MAKVHIIEDDATIREELKFFLSNAGYEVVCSDGELYDEAKDITNIEADVILLDVNLPQKDGFTICMEIRKISKVPVIFVTSRNSEMDELKSITMGGDDFITKPYNISVLLAKIDRALKKVDKNIVKYTHKGVVLDVEAGCLSKEAASVELTKNELKIMCYLFKNVGRIVKRNELIEFLWDNELFIDDNTLSVNITRIRGKLSSIGVEGFIETRHGQGYII